MISALQTRTGTTRNSVHISPSNTEFLLLSFEGPDRYSLAGGLGTRISELAESLAQLGFSTHVAFVGDPRLPGVEERQNGNLILHRWCQWISEHHPLGVYDGEEGKLRDFNKSLPPFVVDEIVQPAAGQGKLVVIMAEEWHTAETLCRIDGLLRDSQLREKALLLWNANNTFSFERIDWPGLSSVATITTVSRYMKHTMRSYGIDPLVIHNGIPRRLLQPTGDQAASNLRKAFGDKLVLTKVARWDPDKRWIAAVEAIALLKSLGIKALFLARGGVEAHGAEVMAKARSLGLRVKDVKPKEAPLEDFIVSLREHGTADILNLKFFLAEDFRRLIYTTSEAVLANSGHEPFGLVGLETMAVGGVAFTGCTGEDYARSYDNAIVLETGNPKEIVRQVLRLRNNPAERDSICRTARNTASRYTWEEVIQTNLVTKLEHLAQDQGYSFSKQSGRISSASVKEPHRGNEARIRASSWSQYLLAGL